MSFYTTTHNLKQPLDTIHFHRVLFVFFLFSLPFSIRKVLAVLSADGTFNEYMDVSVYLSDVLLIMTLLVYVLENKSSILSIEHWKRMFHVEHLLLPIFIPLFFIFWSGLSIFWSQSAFLALVAFIKLIEGYALYLYILISNVPRGTNDKESQECSTWNNPQSDILSTKMFHVEHFDNDTENVPRGTFNNWLFGFIRQCSTWNIVQTIFTVVIISAVFQSIVAILQFIQQRSIGITFLKESNFSIYDPGVAKVLINGDAFVRSYGFFPHPNLLGGFLALSLLVTMAYPLMFKVKMFHVEHSRGIWLYRVVFSVQLLALSLSFSKTAIIAYVIGLTMLVFGMRKMFHVEHLEENHTDVPRGTSRDRASLSDSECSTWNILKDSIVIMFKKMFHVEHLVIIVGVVLLGIVLLSFNLRFFLIQPFIERLFYMESLRGLSQVYFFQGLGIGQFVFTMQQFFDDKLLLWQLQPIHNVFLLIFSEGGIISLGLFLWFFIYVFLENNKNVPRGTMELKQEKCSTWNISESNGINTRMFHVEHSSNIPLSRDQEGSRRVIMAYLFQSILVAIASIMLFDHYFWDIQQGQLLLWVVLALAISRK